MVQILIPYKLADGKAVWLFVNLGTYLALDESDRKAKALHKQDDRHHDNRDADSCPGLWFNPPLSLEEQYERKESRCELHRAMACLTATQARRVRAHYFEGQTYERIAMIENVDWTSIRESIHASLKKMKKFLETPQKPPFSVL